jgi:hypothetical protein
MNYTEEAQPSEPEKVQAIGSKWAKEEDFLLVSLIASYGPRNWNFIADLVNKKFPMTKKTTQECRDRWQSKLDISISHSVWTKEEEALLMLYHMKHKNNWRAISNVFKKRHNDMVKNRFYSIFRRVKNKLRNFDLSHGNEIELYETYYILSIIEEHIGYEVPMEEKKRKRAKSFIYKLIEGLDIRTLKDYTKILHQHYPLKETLKDSLERIADGHSEFSSHSTEVHHTHHSPIERITLPLPFIYTPTALFTPEEKEFLIKQCFPLPALKFT